VFPVQREYVFWKVLYAINSAAREGNGTYIRACLLFCLVGATLALKVRGTGIDLGHYRKARRLRSADLRRLPLRAAEKSSADLWLHDDYRERMKVNAVVLVFLLLLITSGVWLLDGLAASFGPERLLHHHAQNRDMDTDRMVSLPGKIGDLL
jgi:hypothetical protein